VTKRQEVYAAQLHDKSNRCSRFDARVNGMTSSLLTGDWRDSGSANNSLKLKVFRRNLKIEWVGLGVQNSARVGPQYKALVGNVA